MQKIKMLRRSRVAVEKVPSGNAFKMVGKDECLQVIDLTRVDGFTESPVLRDDVVYYVNMESGVVGILPKNVEVELVCLDIGEMLFNDGLPGSFGKVE